MNLEEHPELREALKKEGTVPSYRHVRVFNGEQTNALGYTEYTTPRFIWPEWSDKSGTRSRWQNLTPGQCRVLHRYEEQLE